MEDIGGAVAVARGCGTREKGGVYLECGLSADGVPIEEFYVDPPRAVDLAALGVTAIGTKLIFVAGVWHVVDVVGADSYPNVADYLEEVKRFGMSRRISRSTDFSRLSRSSRVLLIHKRACITNANDYTLADGALWQCPREIPEHAYPAIRETPVCCAGVWWRDVTGGEQVPDGPEIPTFYWEQRGYTRERLVERLMPSFSYRAMRAPDEVVPRYQHGIFAQLPISRLVVVRDPEGATHEDAVEAASKAEMPVVLVEE